MKPRPKEVKAKILLHRRISGEYFRLRLSCPEIASLARPGQFVLLRVNEGKDPFLRRPFSFSQIFLPRGKKRKPIDEGGVEICYQIVGRGTSALAQQPEGKRLDVLGPLGKGFWTEPDRSRAILLGGGIGVAPLLSWARELLGSGRGGKKGARNPEEGFEVLFLAGGKSKERVLGIPELRKMGLEPLVSTEDGSLGLKGMATDLLERELLAGRLDSNILYACGPMSMLARVAQMAEQFDLPCQVLLESRMACGVGACLGCTVKVREEKLVKMDRRRESSSIEEGISGGMEGEYAAEGFPPVISEVPPFRYARACKEGPVFDARKIFWE